MQTKDKNGIDMNYSVLCKGILRKVKSTLSFFSKKDDNNEVLVLTNLRKKVYTNGEEIIKRRKREVEQILNIFSKRKNRNVIIFGERGTGRKQLIDGVVQSIKDGNYPRFKNSLILKVSAEQFLPGNEAVTGVKILKLVEIARRFPNTIFFIDEIEKLIEYNIIDAFELVFKYSICIGIMDNENMNFDLEKYHFIGVNAENPEKKDLYALTKGKLKEIEKFHNNVKITRDSFKVIVDQTMEKTLGTKIGDILNIADEAAGVAANRGMERVDIKAVLETNRHNIDTMLRRSEYQNRFFATHEAGHAIVALHYNVVINEITIIPMDDGTTGGFNLFEFDKNSLDSKDDILRNIEIGLGGYVGTIVKGYPLTCGAMSDLIEVNKIERAMFLYLGMESNKAISYLNDNGELEISYMSEKMKNDLNSKIELNITKRIDKVNEIIRKNEDKFNLIIEALMKKGFLTKDEILSLYNDEITLEEISDLKTLLF